MKVDKKLEKKINSLSFCTKTLKRNPKKIKTKNVNVTDDSIQESNILKNIIDKETVTDKETAEKSTKDTKGIKKKIRNAYKYFK